MNCTRRRIVINQRRTFYTEMVSLTTYEEEQRDVADDSTDPYVVLRNKTKALAELLHCDEAQAERIILQRCDV